MKLVEKYNYIFDDEAVELGCKILKAQQVTCYRTSDIQVLAEVDADEFCEVCLQVKENLLEMNCECRKAQDNIPCEHIYATLATSDRLNDLGKATKRSVKKLPIFPNGKVPKTLQKEGKPELQAKPAKEEKPVNKQQDGTVDDELTVEKIIAATNLNSYGNQQQRPSYLIYYFINLDNCDEEIIQIQTFWCQQKADGSLSDFQPILYDQGEVWPSIEDDFIMRNLNPFQKTVHSTSGLQVGNMPQNLFDVPVTKHAQLLPVMAKTGRLAYRQNMTAPQYQLLTFKPVPYYLGLKVEPDQRSNYSVQAFLQQENEQYTLQDIIYISPAKILITSTSLMVFEHYKALKWLRQIAKSGPMFLPKDNVNSFMKEVIETTNLPLPELPEELSFGYIDSEVKGFLYLQTAKYKFRGAEQLHGELSFNYSGVLVGEDEELARIMNPQSGEFHERNYEQEEMLKKWLKSLGLRYNTNPASEEVGWKLLPKKLDEVVKVLINHDWDVVAEGKTYRKPQEKHASLSFNMDWFELEASVDYGNEKVALPDLIKSWKQGKDFIQLGDGSFGVLPVEWLKNYTVLTEIGLEKEELITFKRSQVLLLDAFLAEKKAANINFDMQKVKNAFANFAGMKVAVVPNTFCGQLRHYQQEGLTWLLFLQKFGFGGCLADDMGLGKTVQVLALLESRRVKSDKPSLVVVPKSLIFNWVDEAKHFTPQMRVHIHSGASRDKTGKSFRKYDLILTTYGTLRQDIMKLKDVLFDYCILDEAQAIKNVGTETAKAVRAICADFRLTMTGTPIENHLGELLSQFEFLNPGMFGRISAFKSLMSVKRPPTADELAPAKKAIKPFLLRRKKEEVAKDLPPKTEQVLYCELEDGQRKHYDELKDYYRQMLLEDKENKDKKKKGGSIEVLEALLRLRQAACHPGLINEKYVNAQSTKLDLLYSMIEELIEENHKMLLFSQFTKFLAFIKTYLDKKNIDFCYLDGATKDRGSQVEMFQNNEAKKVFLISLKAGGVGLNLTAADYVFLLDPWWNPAIEAQAIDRAYRIGQDKHVIAYRMIAKDTVEEKVMQMQQKKRELADAIIQANSQQMNNLSKDDLQFLFS